MAPTHVAGPTAWVRARVAPDASHPQPRPRSPRGVHDISLRRRPRALEAATELLGGGVARARITVLGAASTPDSAHICDCPALDVAHTRHGLGADVRVHDPDAPEVPRRTGPGSCSVDPVLDRCRDADAVVHLTG